MTRHTAWPMRMAVAFALLAAVCSTQVVAVEPAPVERSGSTCPSGYRTSGAYCVPRTDDSKAAMPRAGSTCPSGYRSSGA